MKDKILTFIIGFLVGCIITTLGFYIYQKVNNSNMQAPEIPNGDRQMQQQMMRPEDGGTPPEIPSDFEGQTNRDNQYQMPIGNYGNI